MNWRVTVPVSSVSQCLSPCQFLEGTQSSLQDVLAAEARILAPDRPQDVDEVVNYVRAMQHGLARLAELPVSVRLIREIHAELLQGVRGAHLTPGEIRTSQNWIGPSGCTLNEATFVPPPPHEVAQHLSELERFLHTDTRIPLLIKIGLAHVQFETIHPFLDGNGRVDRLLVTFLLCEREVLLKPVLYLSYFFKRHRQQYYEHLQAVRDTGAWEDWLQFFLRGVVEVSGQATETARKILSLREQHRLAITECTRATSTCFMTHRRSRINDRRAQAMNGIRLTSNQRAHLERQMEFAKDVRVYRRTLAILEYDADIPIVRIHVRILPLLASDLSQPHAPLWK